MDKILDWKWRLTHRRKLEGRASGAPWVLMGSVGMVILIASMLGLMSWYMDLGRIDIVPDHPAPTERPTKAFILPSPSTTGSTGPFVATTTIHVVPASPSTAPTAAVPAPEAPGGAEAPTALTEAPAAPTGPSSAPVSPIVAPVSAPPATEAPAPAPPVTEPPGPTVPPAPEPVDPAPLLAPVLVPTCELTRTLGFGQVIACDP